MSDKMKELQRLAEKHEKRELEAARKKKAALQLMKDIERDADTLRKILDGAHMQTEALTNPDVAALLQRHRDEKLIRDRDREVFGLPRLSAEEKASRGQGNAPPRKAAPKKPKTKDAPPPSA